MKKLLFILFFGALCYGVNAQYWNTTGNANTSPPTNYIGTSDAKPLIFKTSGVERMRLLEGKPFLGIGTSNPQAPLHINYLHPPIPPEDDPFFKMFHITTPLATNGFSISYLIQNQNFFLRQHENANFHIIGPGGGITIEASGNVVIGNAPNPSLIVNVNGLLKAKSADIIGAITAQSANITGTLTTNTLNLQNINVTGTLTSNTLNSQSASITGTLTSNILNSKDANITGTLTANTLKVPSITGNVNFTGNVGIGHPNPTTKLDVKGTIRAEEVKVCLNQGCDFVFEEDYELMVLEELEKFIKTNKHLPEVAPAAIMEAEGINVSEMSAKLLQKIEELTLYILQQEKKMLDLQLQINELKNR